jgi:serine protease
VPTRETKERMDEWDRQHPAKAAVKRSRNTLAFGGGIDGIGVTSGTPRVYLVFYGSQWNGSGDPHGAATYLQNLFHGIGTGGEHWSGTMTQYCDGPTVARGATSCNTQSTPHVGYPSAGAFAGVWFDNASAAPSQASSAQLAAEAVRGAAHFGNTTAAKNRYAQYVVVSPSGTHPDGFGSANFCAWHDYTTSSYGDIAYTNMPYVTDLGASCGENFVNPGSAGLLDGFSIVNGHEYAETLTDQNPAGGWTARSGAENGDECAWISSGHGASADVTMGNGAYAMQSTWSNDTSACEISHTIL